MLTKDVGASSADYTSLFAYWTVVKVRDDNQRTAYEIYSNHFLSALNVLKYFRSLPYPPIVLFCKRNGKHCNEG